MHSVPNILTMALLLLGITGCNGMAGSRHQNIEFHRSGGFAGVEDEVSITWRGEIKAVGPTYGHLTGSLTGDQMDELDKLFEGWNSLDSAYREPVFVSDSFEYSIRYGKHRVVAGQLADAPARFDRAREHLEELARSLRRERQ